MSSIATSSALRVDRKVISQTALVAGITLIGVALRLYRIGDWSFWIDEIITVQAAQGLTAWDVTQYPAFLAFVGAAMGILGTSEWSARLVPALVGVVTIPSLYLIARRMFDAKVALVAVLLPALSPWHIYWSQNARFYTIVLLLFTTALFAFYVAIEDDRPSYLVIAGALLFLAARERVFAMFLIPIAGLYLILVYLLPFERPKGLTKRNLALLLVLGGGLTLMFSLPFLQSPAQWTDTFNRINTGPIWLASGVAFYVGIPTITLAAFMGVYLLQRRDRAALLLVIAAIIPLAGVMLLSLVQYAANRHVFMTLPSYLILAAVGVRELIKRSDQGVRLMAIGILMVLVLTSLSENVLYYQYQNGNRDDWKGAFEILQTKMQPGDLVVSSDPRLSDYYLGRPTVGMQGLALEVLESTERPMWLVEDMNTAQRFPEIANWIDQNTELVANLDVHVRARNFVMRVYSFTPPN